MVINHLLNGMILQVGPCFLGAVAFPSFWEASSACRSVLLMTEAGLFEVWVMAVDWYTSLITPISGWWNFKYFLFSTLFGEDEPILTKIFQMGWNHQLDLTFA